MGLAGPDVLPEYLTEECDHAIVEMDTRQRRTGWTTGKIRLASGQEIPHPQAKGLHCGTSRRTLKSFES